MITGDLLHRFIGEKRQKDLTIFNTYRGTSWWVELLYRDPVTSSSNVSVTEPCEAVYRHVSKRVQSQVLNQLTLCHIRLTHPAK